MTVQNYGATPTMDPSALPPPPTQSAFIRISKAIQKFIIDEFLLISFAAATIIALLFPSPGAAASKPVFLGMHVFMSINNFIVFLISGLTLKTEDFRQIKKHWIGALYGVLAILLITPAFGFITPRLPIQPPEFAIGLTIFCVVPTTLGVGVTLVAEAKGNQPLALFLTVVTNMLGILSMPPLLKLLFWAAESGAAPTVDPVSLFVKLVVTVVVPTIIGKVATSYSAHVRNFVKEHKVFLKLFSTLQLALILWQTLSGAQNIIMQQSPVDILIVFFVAAALHVVMLIFNALVVFPTSLPLQEAIAVVIMASQKSSPVAVAVISYITHDPKQLGLFIIPCVLGQLSQIFIGSFLAKYFAKKVRKAEIRDEVASSRALPETKAAQSLTEDV